jgi:hypothetical protein
MGVIILVREIASAAISANVLNALMASGGVALLVLALWVARVIREKRLLAQD